jgi:putative transposase
MKTDLTLRAIDMAIVTENPPEGVIFHSERGTQYAAYRYQNRLRECNIRQSMAQATLSCFAIHLVSRKGNCFDNACAESFFATLKKDLIHGKRYNSKQEAKSEIIEYIAMFYNCKRLSSKLGYKSPKQYRNDYDLDKSA